MSTETKVEIKPKRVVKKKAIDPVIATIIEPEKDNNDQLNLDYENKWSIKSGSLIIEDKKQSEFYSLPKAKIRISSITAIRIGKYGLQNHIVEVLTNNEIYQICQFKEYSKAEIVYNDLDNRIKF